MEAINDILKNYFGLPKLMLEKIKILLGEEYLCSFYNTDFLHQERKNGWIGEREGLSFAIKIVHMKTSLCFYVSFAPAESLALLSWGGFEEYLFQTYTNPGPGEGGLTFWERESQSIADKKAKKVVLVDSHLCDFFLPSHYWDSMNFVITRFDFSKSIESIKKDTDLACVGGIFKNSNDASSRLVSGLKIKKLIPFFNKDLRIFSPEKVEV